MEQRYSKATIQHESQPAISCGRLNPDAPGIYIQTLSKMNDTDDGMSSLPVMETVFLTMTFFSHTTKLTL